MNIYFRFVSYIFIFIITVGCSYPQYPTDLLASKNSVLTYDTTALSNAYPHWNVGFGKFLVVNETVRADLIGSVSDSVKYKAKRLEIKEKNLMLEKLALIRFVINTREFEDELMKATLKSAVNASGVNGKISSGDIYDNKRILEILKRRKYNLTIRKGIITAGAAAVGVVGPSLYVLSDNDKATSNAYWIAFPNHEDWSTGGYLNDTYMAGIVLHEMIHNSGFSHNNPIDPNDATYGIQGVFTKVYGKKEFRAKYKNELTQFRGYYTNAYKELLKNPTLYSANVYNTIDEDIYTVDNKLVICTLFHDGSSILE